MWGWESVETWGWCLSKSHDSEKTEGLQRLLKLTLQDEVTSPMLLPHVLSLSSLCWIQMVQHLPLSVRIREFHGKQFLVVPGNCFHLRNEFFVSIVHTSLAWQETPEKPHPNNQRGEGGPSG